jgi:N-acyl-D-amino-acid deacylase
MRNLIVLIVCLFAANVLAVQHDLIIRHGKIIDGAGNAWFYGDVAIDAGKISAVGDLIDATATQEIDASELIVAPGFIDVHTHADTDLYRLPQAENFIRDGVTTIVVGNCGGSVRNVGEYFSRLKEKGVALNVATFIGHNTILRAVKGDKAGELTPEQMTRAKEIVAKAMRDGAVGMSTGLIYTPGTYSKTEEIIELQKVASSFGGIYASHMRSESNGIMAAIDEALRIGREANCRVEISHFKLPHDVSQRIGGSDATLKRVLDARASGQEVWMDQYPYTASSTSLSTMLPDWVLENGNDKAREILQSEAGLKRTLGDMKKQNEVTRHRTDMSYAVIASCRQYPQYVGRSIKQAAQMMKLAKNSQGKELLAPQREGEPAAEPDKPKDTARQEPRPPDAPRPPEDTLPVVTMDEQYRAVIDIFLHGGAGMVFHTMDETDVVNILRCPLISIASDSGVREIGTGQPHPRGYGTNARVLGRYVREQHVITLEDAVRKMTSQPATAFRFLDRGLLRAGFAADVTIFDPQRVADLATFDKPHQYSVGIDYVIVNGQVVMEHEKMTGKLAGVGIRGPGWDGKVAPTTQP